MEHIYPAASIVNLQNKTIPNYSSPAKRKFTTSSSSYFSNVVNSQVSCMNTTHNPQQSIIPTSTLKQQKLYSRQNSVSSADRNQANLSYLSSETLSKNSSNKPRFFQLEKNISSLSQTAKQFVQRQNAIVSHKRTQSQNKEIKLSSISSQNQRATTQMNIIPLHFSSSSKQLHDGLDNQNNGIPQLRQKKSSFFDYQTEHNQDSIHQDYKNSDEIKVAQAQNLLNHYSQYYGGGQLHDQSRWNVVQYNLVTNSTHNFLTDKTKQRQHLSKQNSNQTDKQKLSINFPNLSTSKKQNREAAQKSNTLLIGDRNLKIKIMSHNQRYHAQDMNTSVFHAVNSSNEIQLNKPLNSQSGSSSIMKQKERIFSLSYSNNNNHQMRVEDSLSNHLTQNTQTSERQSKRVSKNIRNQTSYAPALVQSELLNMKLQGDTQFMNLIKQSLNKNQPSKQTYTEQAENDQDTYQSVQETSRKANFPNIPTETTIAPKINLDEIKDFQLNLESCDSTPQTSQHQKMEKRLIQTQQQHSFKTPKKHVTITDTPKNKKEILIKQNAHPGQQNQQLSSKNSNISNNSGEKKKLNIMITPQQIIQLMESEQIKKRMEKQKMIYDLVKQVEENPLDNMQVQQEKQNNKQNIAFNKEIAKKNQSNSLINEILKSKSKQSVEVIQDILKTNNVTEFTAQIESLIKQRQNEQLSKSKPLHIFQQHKTLNHFSQAIQNATGRSSFRQMQYSDFIQEDKMNTHYYNDSLSPRDKNVVQIQAINENKFVNQISKDQIIQRKNGSILRKQLKEALHYIFKLKISPGDLINHVVFSTKPYQKQGSYELICCSKKGDIEKAKDLVSENKYLVYDFDYVYMTALHWACKRGHFQIAQLLIQSGADVDAKDLLLLLSSANPWSSTEYNLNEVIKDDPKISALISKFRKLDIVQMMRMPTISEESKKKQVENSENRRHI